MTACPQCSNNSNKFLNGINADEPSKRLPILKCEKCDLVFTDQSFIETAPKELYFDGYYGEKKSESLPNRLANGIFQRERQSLTISKTKPKKVLDVGCGDGTYLRYLPRGIHAFGYEPSEAGRHSLERHKISYFDINSVSPSDRGTFDLITLWQSFEHVDDPDELLEKLKPLLAPGGRIFLSVPHISSFQAKLFGAYWFHLDPTRHLFHYSVPTLKTVMARNGLEVEGWSTRSIEYGIFGWWQSLFNLVLGDFNMGYKVLKGRKRYEQTAKNRLSLAGYAILALPFAALATLLTFTETLFARGGVIHIWTRPKIS
jgi:SAM-dependent methyltransferase